MCQHSHRLYVRIYVQHLTGLFFLTFRGLTKLPKTQPSHPKKCADAEKKQVTRSIKAQKLY